MTVPNQASLSFAKELEKAKTFCEFQFCQIRRSR